MAEQSVSGNGQAMQTAAKGAIYQELGRVALPLICTIGSIALALGVFIGMRVIEGQEKMAVAVAAMTIDVAVMKVDIGYLKERARP